MVPVVTVAGTHSGVGKTSLATGLMLALRQRGLVVQPFKVGPDFLDPMHHAAACGRQSINLDGWMLNQQQVLDTFQRHTSDADVAVVEGVMGLFDSRDGATDEGSTGQIAKWLRAPVVLVVDCWAMARSAAALVKGYAEFDADLQFAGVLFNKVGSAGHGTWLTQALEAAWQQGRLKQSIKVLGCIPKDDSVVVAERYLGLTMPHEQQADDPEPLGGAAAQQQSNTTTTTPAAAAAIATQLDPPVPAKLLRLADHVRKHVDLDQLLEVAAAAATVACTTSGSAALAGVPSQQQQLAQQHEQRPPQPCVHRPLAVPVRCRIAVARDEAFCFYYHDNLALLRAAGAELVFFSPLRSTHLPDNIAGIYLGGGYPERHAQQLSSNTSLLQQVREWADTGGVVYAECGGLIYLCQGFQPSAGDDGQQQQQQRRRDEQGSSSSDGADSGSIIPLVGVLPLVARMGGMKMGYVEVEVMPGNPLFPPGVVRGQVYHFSEVQQATATTAFPAHESNPSSTRGSGASSSTKSSGSSSSSGCPASNVSPAGGEGASGSSAAASGSGSDMQLTYRLQQLLPGAQPRLEGYSVGNVLASYVHLHWGGCPELAAAFVDKCCSVSTSSTNNIRSSSSKLGSTLGSIAQPESGSSSGIGSSSSSSSGCCCVPAGGADNGTCRLGSNSTPSSSSGSSSSSSRSRAIVSLLPSGTEILYALGLQDRLMGVSGFCDFPPEAQRDKPCAVRSLIDVDAMTSSEIEAAMQSFKASGVSPFAVDGDLLTQHKPGLLLTQDACRTCDADCSVVCLAMQQAGLSPSTTRVLVLHPKTLSEVLDSIITIGTAAGVPDRAQQLVAQLQSRLAAVAAAVQAVCPAAAAVTTARATTSAGALSCTAKSQTGGCDDRAEPAQQQGSTTTSASSGGDEAAVPAAAAAATDCDAAMQQQQHQQEPHSSGDAPRVLSLEGINPLVIGGQWLPDVKLAAGALDASGQQPGDPPTRIQWEQVLQYNPDVLLLCPCSRSPTAAMPDVTLLTQRPGFKDLPAVASGRVYVIDHSLFSRPGPRLVDGVELLAQLLWSEQQQQQPLQEQLGGAGCSVTEGCERDGSLTSCSFSVGAAAAPLEHAVLRIQCCKQTGDIRWVPL